MKIKIDKSRGKFDKQDLDYIQLLQYNKAFEELVDEARKDLGITNNSLLKNYPTAKIYSLAQKHASKIVSIFSLPTPWIQSISDFIVMGKFTTPGPGIFLSGFATNYPSGEAVDFQITVTQKTSLDEIHKLLRKNKKAIQKHLSKLPIKNSPISSESKIKLEAYELHYKGLKPKKIVEELDKLYKIGKYDFEEGYLLPSAIDVSRWIGDLDRKLQRKPR